MKNFDHVLGKWLGKGACKQTILTLGPREIDVLKILWRTGELSAQMALQQITCEQITLSTMQSTLERLHRKGLVARHKTGRSYLYKAAINQRTIISHLLQDIALQISDGEMAPMISGFMSFVCGETPELTNSELKKLILHAMKDQNE